MTAASRTIKQRPAHKLRSGVLTASEMTRELEPGGRLVGLTGGQFSLMDLIEALLVRTGPADVVIATWTAGVRDTEMADELDRLGLIRSMRLVVDGSFVGRQPQYVDRVRAVFGDDAIRTTSIHAKFVSVRNDDWHLLVRTSMNLNRNKRIELFELDDDRDLCDWWHAEVVDPLWADMPPGLTVPGRRRNDVWKKHWGTDDDGDKKSVNVSAAASSALIADVLRGGR